MMTTSRSPLRVLRQQSDKIAAALKAAERGETITSDPAGKIAAARQMGSIKVAVVMDDKVLKIEISWALIRASSEAEISEFILKHMRESRESEH